VLQALNLLCCSTCSYVSILHSNLTDFGAQNPTPLPRVVGTLFPAVKLKLKLTLRVSGSVPVLPLQVFLALGLVLILGQNLFAVLLQVFLPHFTLGDLFVF